MAKRTRARKGHPKGKAYGFRGMRPAAKSQTQSSGGSQSGASTQSTSTASTPSTSSS